MNETTTSYVYTPAQVTAMARELNSAIVTVQNKRQSYLQVLAGTTIAELNATPRVRAGKPVKLTEDGISKQLAALSAVHERFYPAVLEGLADDLPATGKVRHMELHRRGNFARTALSALRAYIKAGNDLTSINVAKVSKGYLRVASASRSASPTRMKLRMERRSHAFMESVLVLAEADKGAAVEELKLVMGQLAARLAELGVTPTRDQAEAVSEGIPLRVGRAVFIQADSSRERPH